MCFFFNDTATTEIYTLSLHDALPILGEMRRLFDGIPLTGMNTSMTINATAMWLLALYQVVAEEQAGATTPEEVERVHSADRKSTRLNSSHANISYAVFCLKKKTVYIY